MGSLVEFAKSEMERAWPESDETQDMVKANILQLMGVVENQGHSGFSISYVMSVFKRLVQFKPLKPLTGEEDEWLETDYGSTQQNKRFSEVFRENGEAYWVHGRVFREKDGNCFVNSESRVKIESFPWTVPDSPEYVDVEK